MAKITKMTLKWPKMTKNGQNNGHFFYLETNITLRKPILTPNFSSFGLQIAEKIEKDQNI